MRPAWGSKMLTINENQIQKVAGGLFVVLASALLAVPFVAVGAFVLQIY
jgi:hypothetical protein